MTTIKIKVWVSTNKVGSLCEDTIEIDREEWQSMSDEEQADMCSRIVWKMAGWGWEELK